MISMQQLEELEVRVVKALQLIGDLRSENAQLESENDELKSLVEQVRLSLEEKDQEVARAKEQLDEANKELNEIRERGFVLEKKVVNLLGRLDSVQGGEIPEGDPAPAVVPAAAFGVNSALNTDKLEEITVDTDMSVSVPGAESVQEDETAEPEPVQEITESENFIFSDEISSSAGEESQDISLDDDIILLDDDQDMKLDEAQDSASVIKDDSDDFIVFDEDPSMDKKF